MQKHIPTGYEHMRPMYIFVWEYAPTTMEELQHYNPSYKCLNITVDN